MGANKAMASRRDMVRTKVTAINKAMMAMASSKVTQGAITEPTTDLTSHAPTMIRVMDSKEATVGTKAMAIKTTMVATRAMNSLGMASIRALNTNSLATARTKVPSMT